ncbi:MAG: BON domain-containing protein [Gammaproteobacteria bacterium]|nr:BON domain-containing protein [Gammaproteobacteria bacterium]
MRPIKRNLITLGVVAALAGNAWATESAPRTVGVVIDDAAITTSIKTKLTLEKDTKARQINVETQKGIVQLNGFVDSSAARSEAEKIAAGTDGVKQVRNNLEVRSADRPAGEVVDDAMITGKVEAALVADKRTSALRVDIETHEGEVQLSGFARNQAEKDAAAAVARAVTGVRKVTNSIDVR